ncbi:MAG: HAMP domain-containing protein, partial [Desulfobacteraceae bacterium]|nr:HAMP domain-containing protein [Desulfobacteraceae bacterium]
LQRAKNVIDNELSNLEILCVDWSSWDDIYDYVNNRNDRFEATNLPDGIMQHLGIHLFFILNSKNEVVWRGLYDHDFENDIDLKGFDKSSFPENHQLLKKNSANSKKSIYNLGVLDSENGPILIASSAILKSNDEGPVTGTVIMGKYLSKNITDNLDSQLQIGFKIIPFDELKGSEKIRSIEAEIINKDWHIETGKEKLNVYTAYLDINSNIAFILKVPFPRDISKNWKKTLLFSSVLILVMNLLILLVLHFLLRKFIIKPILVLTDFTSDIKLNNNFHHRVSIKQTDEIGTLADSMNNMVSNIADKTNLLTQSNLRLQKSLDEIRTLRGILPICCHCKEIRDDEGYWHQIECYI